MTNKKRTRFIDTTHAPWNQQPNLQGKLGYFQIKAPVSPEEILEHIKQEIVATLETGKELDHDWEEIRSYHLRASLKLKTGNIPEIFWALFKLGCIYERLQHPTNDEFLNILDNRQEELQRLKKLEVAEASRQQPLKLKNYTTELVKETAQEIADKLWQEDTDNITRLTKMCEDVYPKLITSIEYGIENYVDLINDGNIASALRKAIPKKPDGLKPWLRDIAPNYASKEGRPKN